MRLSQGRGGTAPRIAAVRALVQVIRHRRSLEAVLDDRPSALDARDDGLRRELCYGTLRHGLRLQRVLDRLLERPLKARDADVRTVLLTGLYQILYLRVPDHAAVSASVEAAGELGKAWARGLVNAVLRRFLREQAEVMRAIEREPEGRHGHPRWLVDAIGAAWPEQQTAILDANDTRPPMTLRLNQRRVDRHSYLERLRADGLDAAAVDFAPHALTLAEPCRVEALPGFEAGDVSVQDAAAQLAAPLLDAGLGDRVLDACAAPGGKTAHILERSGGVVQVTAVDADATRSAKIHASLDRLSLEARVICADVRRPRAWWDGSAFERVLVDAPCTATGVIRRHPDIKWLRRAADVDSMARRQQEIVRAAWRLVAAGGVLLYATCSVLPQENDEVIEALLASGRDARSRPIDADWGRATAHGRQILPGEHGMDGFYYALVAKR